MSDEEREVGNEMRQFIIWRPRLRIATCVACAWNGLVFRCFWLIDSIRFPCTDPFSFVDFLFLPPISYQSSTLQHDLNEQPFGLLSDQGPLLQVSGLIVVQEFFVATATYHLRDRS